MYEFSIQNMTCGHCAGTVEKAIKAADPAAQTKVDLSTKTAKVETTLDPSAIAAAIENAGYPNSFTSL
ncbi:heavy-metal-associated domain-containing protein [Rhizobium phaseoli]|uniref:heavy-metal-associated domain-containing protein n=1 Tax=Rhizobium phaseoli TaxID=396 RepID=UPI0025524F65|nr:heavy-metal-associated domain-containing protein [Rhizobium phaseoli]MDK4724960.1 heavy-metal-associated domain-containing protein [Rhizobium phaseoli]